MKKPEQITPEVQIENQKAEIESLQRKCDSLETELRKCLDPDSGELNPARLPTKSERALLNRLNEMENEEEETRQPIRPRLLRKAESIIRAIFGELDNRRYSHWGNFQCFLLTGDSIDHLRADKSFKWGVQMVAYVTASLDKIKAGAEPGADHYKDLADVFLDQPSIGDPTDHQAVLKLIECFQFLKANPKPWGMHSEDIKDLELDLEWIERCQRMALREYEERTEAGS